MVGAGYVTGVFNRPHEPGHEEILKMVRKTIDPVIKASDKKFPDVAVTALEEITRIPRFGHGVATRLLALARPDKLVSVNQGSQNGLAETFKLARTTIGNPRNYCRLLEKLYELPWYDDRPGRSKMEQKLWYMRTALIDSFVY